MFKFDFVDKESQICQYSILDWTIESAKGRLRNLLEKEYQINFSNFDIYITELIENINWSPKYA